MVIFELKMHLNAFVAVALSCISLELTMLHRRKTEKETGAGIRKGWKGKGVEGEERKKGRRRIVKEGNCKGGKVGGEEEESDWALLHFLVHNNLTAD